MNTVTAKDGTTIAFDRLGEGPPIVLISGAMCARMVNAQLAVLLAADFTVLNYDRRGRGDSGDTLPFALEREFDDLEAVIREAGGSAAVFGSSSGGCLALEAAAHGLPITSLVLWEPPYGVDESAAQRHEEYATRLAGILAEGRSGDALAHFMTNAVGMPEAVVAHARTEPWFAASESLAHTLAYDAVAMGDGTVPAKRLASITVPALVIDGSATAGWAAAAADAVAAALPDARRRTLPGQDHNVDPAVLAPTIKEFLAG